MCNFDCAQQKFPLERRVQPSHAEAQGERPGQKDHQQVPAEGRGAQADVLRQESQGGGHQLLRRGHGRPATGRRRPALPGGRRRGEHCRQVVVQRFKWGRCKTDPFASSAMRMQKVEASSLRNLILEPNCSSNKWKDIK